MTREQEIMQAAAAEIPSAGDMAEPERSAFLAGANWADEHPKSPWISVKDRLPEVYKKCFALKDCKTPCICILTKKRSGRCVFETPDEEYEFPDGKITHWMPKPELPKGGEV